MSARFQTAARTNRYFTFGRDLVVETKLDALAAFGKSGGLERERGHDRKCIMHFKNMQVFWVDPSHFIALFCGFVRRAEKQRVSSGMDCNRICVRRGGGHHDARPVLQGCRFVSGHDHCGGRAITGGGGVE